MADLPEFAFPQSVHEYYVRRVRQIAAERDRRLADINSPADARRYCDDVKRRIRDCFGDWPEESPLNARVTGQVERERYTISKVLFESRPGYVVSANLWRPRGNGPFPAVLGLCGHSAAGKAMGPYVQFCRNLAAMGYVVLIIDPVGQGERFQYADVAEAVVRRNPCYEHNLAGNQMSLVGDALWRWRTWDARRALDYLLSLPDIDPARVGVTGTSGGGLMTTYLNALDDRVTMAAPGCFVTTYLANLENELPADSEQYPPGILAAGIDMGDFFLARAPRPVIMLGQQFDFFDVRGLNKTFTQVQRIYQLLGAGDRVQLSIGPTTHGYSIENRLAMYEFFNHHAGVKAAIGELEDRVESAEELQVTPTGAVVDLPGSRRIFDFTAAAARRLAAERPRVGADRLQRVLTDLLHLPPRTQPPHYRLLRERGDVYTGRYPIVQLYGVETEPDHPLPMAVLQAWHKIDPLKGKSRGQVPPQATLYVPHISARDDILGGEVPVAVDETIYAVDVRGIGMMRAITCNDMAFFSAYGADYFYAGHGLMLNESYCGRRVYDLLRTIDLLLSIGTREVHLAGRGIGAVLAAFAGALHPAVRRVTLKNAPPSFQHLAEARVNRWPLSSLPRGVLKVLDLPDVYHALSAKGLQMLSPWDAACHPDGADQP